MEADANIYVYPVHLLVRRRDIWIAWRSSDVPADVLLKRAGGIVHAKNKLDLMAQCLSMDSGLIFEEETRFDLDLILDGLIGGQEVSADALINCWNMLIDIKGGLAPALGASFDFLGGSLLESYDRFFSSTSGADMINFGFDEVRAVDVRNAIEVVSTGMVMVSSFVENLKNRACS